MAVHHLTVTLTGSAQALLTPATGQPSDNCREVQIQSEAANAAVAIGGPGVTITDYGQLIAATSVTPIVLRSPGGGYALNLASTYVIGTVSQKIHVMYVK